MRAIYMRLTSSSSRTALICSQAQSGIGGRKGPWFLINSTVPSEKRICGRQKVGFREDLPRDGKWKTNFSSLGVLGFQSALGPKYETCPLSRYAGGFSKTALTRESQMSKVTLTTFPHRQ